MKTFTCKLEPGDIIYYTNGQGLTLDREIGYIEIGPYGKILYLDKYGDKICSDATLDSNRYSQIDLYFTTKAKRDYALKQLHI